MALGKQIGDFALESKGITVIDDTHMTENWEGTGTLESQEAHVFATTEIEGDASGGVLEVRVAALFQNGNVLRSNARGTYTATAAGRWATRSIDRLDDGRTIGGEGDVDLATHTWNGKLFEWN